MKKTKKILFASRVLAIKTVLVFHPLFWVHFYLKMDTCHELDTELAIDDLKIHTGHDPSDTSNEECDIESDENGHDYVEPVSPVANQWNDSESSTRIEEIIARRLEENITHMHCLICNKTGKTHYSAAPHRRAVKAWIKTQLGTYASVPISRIYCETCNLPLILSSFADIHYRSDYHIKKAQSYCVICQRNLPGPEAMANHLNTKVHHSKASKKDPQSALQKEQPFKPIVPEVINVTEQLAERLTAQYCGICAKYVNLRALDHHYWQKEHILNVRKWLDGQKVDTDKKLLFCEACSVNLYGPGGAQEHYQNATHLYNEKTYCSKCIFRGSPGDLVQHNSKEHPDATQERITSTTWPQELTNLVTVAECKLCSLKLTSGEQASDHYQSASHNENVQEWLDKHNESQIKCETAHNKEMQNINDEVGDEALLKKSILCELKKIVEKLYVSRTMPWEKALVHLKNLNDELRAHENVSNIPKPEQSDNVYYSLTASDSDSDNVPDFYIPPIKPKEKAIEDYAKIKLSMEIRRTKLVLENRTRVPLEIAFHYVHNLNQSLKALRSNGIESFVMDGAFESETDSRELVEVDERQRRFDYELEKLESTLANDKEISVEVALDCIMQFNVQLESLIEDQEDSDDSLDY